MQIRADALAAQLKRDLAPVYTVWGDEPLLMQEACDTIRAAARAAGCSERQVHTVAGQHFDWSGLLGAAQALSLFSDRQLVEIRIPSGKPGKEGSEALQRYCDAAIAGGGRDVITLVQLPRLDGMQQKSAWFAALDRAGVSLRIFPVERAQWRGYGLAPTRLRSAAIGAGDSYTINSVPAGDYIVAAIDRARRSVWLDPAVLTQLEGSGVRVSLGWGAKVTQEVPVVVIR